MERCSEHWNGGGGGGGGWRLKVETGYQWSFLGDYLPTHPSPRSGLQDLGFRMDGGGGVWSRWKTSVDPKQNVVGGGAKGDRPFIHSLL